jgi:hypothetical protein
MGEAVAELPPDLDPGGNDHAIHDADLFAALARGKQSA